VAKGTTLFLWAEGSLARQDVAVEGQIPVTSRAPSTKTTTKPRGARAVSPGRPPKAEVAARLQHILRVASAEFVNRGYADASVSRIAADAGVSKKTIYARYPNKDALLMAVAGELATRAYERVTAAMGAADGEPEEVLTGFGTAIATNWASPETIGVYRLFVSEASRFPQLGSMYRDIMARFRSTLADYLQEQCDAGALHIDDVDDASHQFGMLAYGDIRERKLLGETVTEDDIAATVRRTVDLFLHGYSATDPAVVHVGPSIAE
jgi:AcrR family transcriptional regulator